MNFYQQSAAPQKVPPGARGPRPPCYATAPLAVKKQYKTSKNDTALIPVLKHIQNPNFSTFWIQK